MKSGTICTLVRAISSLKISSLKPEHSEVSARPVIVGGFVGDSVGFAVETTVFAVDVVSTLKEVVATAVVDIVTVERWPLVVPAVVEAVVEGELVEDPGSS